MKIFGILWLLILIFSFEISAQKKQEKNNSAIIGIRPSGPEFPGGDEALLSFFSKRIKHPKDTIESQIEGTVIIEFIVKKNGEITNLKICRGLNSFYNNQALDIARKMPKWKPARDLNGKKVDCATTIPICFHFE
jgi:protein TonB